jgi:hypothetical protein
MSKCYAHGHLFDHCDELSSGNRRCGAAMFICHVKKAGREGAKTPKKCH